MGIKYYTREEIDEKIDAILRLLSGGVGGLRDVALRADLHLLTAMERELWSELDGLTWLTFTTPEQVICDYRAGKRGRLSSSHPAHEREDG